ncbi:MAG: hypothetical protein ACK43N_09235, partial [Pirellulaceae bacterium]
MHSRYRIVHLRAIARTAWKSASPKDVHWNLNCLAWTAVDSTIVSCTGTEESHLLAASKEIHMGNTEVTVPVTEVPNASYPFFSNLAKI